MNERIKELADEAGFVLWAAESWNPGDVIDWSCRYDTEFKKFAELIIRECMRMCDCADSSYLEHGCDKEASGAAGAKQFIKEWFDVEE